MELRHWVAYGLIAVMLVSGSITGVVRARRNARRRLRLRGIKTHENQRLAALTRDGGSPVKERRRERTTVAG